MQISLKKLYSKHLLKQAFWEECQYIVFGSWNRVALQNPHTEHNFRCVEYPRVSVDLWRFQNHTGYDLTHNTFQLTAEDHQNRINTIR
jgi:hypothetical protein